MMYSLLSFGIPTDTIPVSGSDGTTIKTKDLHKWIARRKNKETFVTYHGGDDSLFDKIDLPTRHDVLLAKGRPYQNHPGNIEYLQLIDESLREYESAPNRKGKRDVVRKFVAMMRDTTSARFLIKDEDDWWVEAQEKELHDKVVKSFSHALAMSRKNKSKADHSTMQDTHNNFMASCKRRKIEPRMDDEVVGENKRCLSQSCFVLTGDWNGGLDLRM